MSTYITCFECEYTYASAEELVEKHVALLKDFQREGWGSGPGPEDYDVRNITICPECTHDF